MVWRGTVEDSSQNSPPPKTTTQSIYRRDLVKAGIGSASVVGAAAIGVSLDPSRSASAQEHHSPHGHHLMPTVVGEVNHVRNGFNPTGILTEFDTGTVSRLPNRQTLHEYTIVALNKVIEIVPDWNLRPGPITGA